MENLTFRRAMVGDAPSLRRLFGVSDGLRAYPYQRRSRLLKQLCSDKNLWVVALIDGIVIGCSCVVRHDWNQTWEFSFAVIDPDVQRLGVLTKMIGVEFSLLKSTAHELGFYKPKDASAHFGALEKHAPVLVGHDGGQVKVYGRTEYHMFAIYPVLQNNFIHVSPDYSFDVSTIKNDIYTALDLSWSSAAYPEICFVGQAGVRKWGAFSYFENQNTKTLSFGSFKSLGLQTQEQIFDKLMRFLCFKSAIEYFSACVLADKQALIAHMLEIGFKITAYLPAWFFLSGCRYDCVMLVLDRRMVVPENNGFKKEILRLDRMYAELGNKMVSLK